MAKEQTSSIAFEADISQFSSSIDEMRRDIKLINSQFDASSSSLDDWSSSSEGLEMKLKQLNGVLDAEKKKLKDLEGIRNEYNSTLEKNKNKLAQLREEYEKISKAEGESSDNAKRLAKEMAQVEVAITKNAKSVKYYETEMNKQQATVNRTQKAMDELTTSTSNFGTAMKGIGKGLATGIVAVGSAAVAAATAFIGLAESTREAREDMAKLTSAFDGAGLSGESAKDTFTSMYKVIGETDTAVEASQQIALLAKSEEEAAKWAELATGVTATFGDALKPETFYEAANETLKLGEATGAFTQMLEGTGVNVEEFNKELASMNTEQEKQAYMLKVSEEAMGAAGDAYEKTAGAIMDAREAEANLALQTQNLGAIVEPVVTLLKNHLAVILEKLTPLMTQLAEAFTAFLNGDYTAGAELISGIFSNIGTKAGELFETLINKVSELLPIILPKIVELLGNLLNKIIEFAPVLLDGAIKLFYALVDAIPPTIKAILKALPNIISNLLNFFIENYPKIIKSGYELLLNLIAGIIDCIPDLLDAADEIVGNIIDTIMETDWLDVGLDIMQGILDGMLNIGSSLGKTVAKVGKKIKDGFTDFFDINSPSKLMSDEVGKFIGLGVLDGIEGSMAQVKSGLNNSLNDLTNDMSFGNGVGKSVVVNYTVNSPKQLSRRELYLQSKKMETLLGGVS